MSDNGSCDVPRLTLVLISVNRKTVEMPKKTEKNRKGTKVVTLRCGLGMVVCAVRLEEKECSHEQ